MPLSYKTACLILRLKDRVENGHVLPVTYNVNVIQCKWTSGKKCKNFYDVALLIYTGV